MMRTVSLPTRFDRWFSELDGALQSAAPSEFFTPAIDMLEHADRYEILADLPGVKQGEVDVAFNEGTLTIRGERSVPEISGGEASEGEASERRLVRAERRSGKFARAVVFREEVDVEKIEATFKDGVLCVRVPKIERRKPRQIPVAVH
ncbi:MAG: Hsp20/alpha crystallin family protein [bacterium]|nr:Hsp20/alpha crystallin family protein [bacterium]